MGLSPVFFGSEFFFRLGYNSIGDHGAHAIAEALRNNTALEFLEFVLHLCHLGRVCVHASLLGCMPSLCLSLCYGSLLLKSFRPHPRSLNANSIHESGGKAIAEALEVNNVLKTLR